jgi:hypothetical protein
MEKDLLFKIIALLRITLKPSRKVELRKPITDNLDALWYLFQAIEEGDKRNYDRAKKFLNDAAEADPDTPLDFFAEFMVRSTSGAEINNSEDDCVTEEGKSGKPCAAKKNRVRRTLRRRP